jgi:hypothetical protein
MQPWGVAYETTGEKIKNCAERRAGNEKVALVPPLDG